MPAKKKTHTHKSYVGDFTKSRSKMKKQNEHNNYIEL